MKNKIYAMILCLVFIMSFSSFASSLMPISNQRGWVQSEKGWYYLNDDGSYNINSWMLINNNTYYFDSNGYAVKGWLKLNNDWFYFDDGCRLLRDTTTPDGYRVDETGKWINEENWQWQYINNIWYYRDLNSGKNWTGWAYVNNYWYYMNDKGEMETGLIILDDVLYYLNEGLQKGIPYGAAALVHFESVK